MNKSQSRRFLVGVILYGLGLIWFLVKLSQLPEKAVLHATDIFFVAPMVVGLVGIGLIVYEFLRVWVEGSKAFILKK